MRKSAKNARKSLKRSILRILRDKPFVLNGMPPEIKDYVTANKSLNPKRGIGGGGVTQMYMACRHIKPNGLRCQSPALRGFPFCYFHPKLHAKVSYDDARFGPITLPVPEDRAAIQISISRILDAMLNNRLDGKLAGRLLYGLQIASQHAEHHILDIGTDSVETMTQSKEGDELAPRLRVCDGSDICVGCKYAENCPNFDPENDGNDGEEEDDEDEE